MSSAMKPDSRAAAERELALVRRQITREPRAGTRSRLRRRLLELEESLAYCQPGLEACREPGAEFCGCDMAAGGEGRARL